MAVIELSSVELAYPIYSVRVRSLRNAIADLAVGGRLLKDGSDVVHVKALDGVSFRLGEGDRMGIVGHNGAGKTTLLKVIAGIYEPDKGLVSVKGRITPLINNNHGVDRALSGRENIIKMGRIRGYSTREVLAKMDDIIEFTDLGKFIDLPVRTYSAGMAARLIFGVATTLEPDILLMDEWISAGDAGFLDKATMRMNDVLSRSRIMVLASHSDKMIRKMCNKVLVLNGGQQVYFGDVEGWDFDMQAPVIALSDTVATPTSTACLVVRNGADYLLEWIAYHQVLGFDKIVVYDDRSTDASAGMLKRLANAGTITYRKWKAQPGVSAQLSAYQDAYERMDTDWIYFANIDEFLVLHKHVSVAAFLTRDHNREDVSVIGINHRTFGDSHQTHFDDGLVTERFTRAAQADYSINRTIGGFVRAGKSAVFNYAIPDATGLSVRADGSPLELREGKSPEVSLRVAQVNHYVVKSYAEFQNRMGEGEDADSTLSVDWFHRHNFNDMEDLSVQNILPRVKAEVAALKGVLGPAKTRA